MRIFGPILLCLCFPFLAAAQTSISGVINTYLPVTGVRPANCANCDSLCTDTLILNSVAGLSAVPGAQGNKVLLIQMQAGTAGTINSGAAFQFNAAYGQATNFGGAGNWEFAYIHAINGNEISFTAPLLNTYDPGGASQVIPVPVFGSALTTGTLLGQAWNGATGGVLVLECSGTLTLNDSIQLDGIGFRGGTNVNSGSACCNSTAIDAALRFGYFWDETQNGGGPPCSAARQARFGAEKGEGIFPLITGERIGRGAFANGGGGGSGHNSGGGGGGNSQAGGLGGYEWDGCAQAVADQMNGVGGYGLTNGNALFLGGGGGSGHGNNNTGTSGANGGGIIILLANQIDVAAAGLEISADGLEPGQLAGNDSAGGGGGGGSVLLDVGSFTGNPLTVSANGGNGGSNTVVSSCHGPGGGGGAGVIRSTGILPIAGLTTSLAGGAAGFHTADATCGTYGSGSGGSSAAADGTTVNINPCTVLPQPVLTLRGAVEDGKKQLLIDWQEGLSFGEFRVFRGSSPEVMSEVDRISPGLVSDLTWTDRQAQQGTSWYRLEATGTNGELTSLGPISLTLTERPSLTVYPNPVKQGELIRLDLGEKDSNEIHRVCLRDLSGKEVTPVSWNVQHREWPASVSPGLYILTIKAEKGQFSVLVSILP